MTRPVDCLRIWRDDQQLREVLEIVARLGLDDSWLAAGAVRNMIWNALSGQPTFDKATDMDVVFYDESISDQEIAKVQDSLNRTYPEYRWELTNQAKMHHYSPRSKPYTSTCDAVSKYPETCTALALKLDSQGEITVFAPYGFDDLLGFEVRPTPHFAACPERMAVYHHRIGSKDWSDKFPRLRYFDQFGQEID